MVRINDVRFEEIDIDKRTYYSDMIVWWDGKLEFKEKFHIFDHNDLAKLMIRNPEIIIVGTGVIDEVKVTDTAKEIAEQKKIELLIEKPKEAADIFNGFVADKRRVVAVIHTS